MESRLWRTRVGQSSGIRMSNEKDPGDGTSVDQIVCAQPGLVPQMAGSLTLTSDCIQESQYLWIMSLILCIAIYS